MEKSNKKYHTETRTIYFDSRRVKGGGNGGWRQWQMAAMADGGLADGGLAAKAWLAAARRLLERY